MQVVLGIILGIIVAFIYISFFGDDNTYKIDEAEARNVELARKLKEALDENKEIKELRKQAVHNSTTILNVNRKQEKLIKEIEALSTINTYDNEKAVLGKIKELVHDYKSKN